MFAKSLVTMNPSYTAAELSAAKDKISSQYPGG